MGASEFGLPVDLAGLDLLNFLLAEHDRLCFKSFFLDHIMSDAVCFVGVDAESMPLVPTYSSFPAMRLTSDVGLDMGISVTFTIDKFAFDCTIYRRNPQMSLAVIFVIQQVTVVCNSTSSCLPADARELFVRPRACG